MDAGIRAIDGALTADDALAAVDSLLDEFRTLLRGCRAAFSEDDCRRLAPVIRRRVAFTCTDVGWILRGDLSTIDEDIFRALRRLEPVRGEQFRTTGHEVWGETRSASRSVVYVALHRLAHLGLIELEVQPGNLGSLVRINWDRFELRQPVAGAA